MQEIKEYMKLWVFWLGLIGAFVDGLIIAQAWDWITNAHRMSIWLLM